MSHFKITEELVVGEKSNTKVWNKNLKYRRIVHSNCFRSISKNLLHSKKIKTERSYVIYVVGESILKRKKEDLGFARSVWKINRYLYI